MPDAVYIVDKPRGITSHDAVTLAKRLLGARKAGHAGTLDPMATGVLLVCLDEATKVTRFLMDMEKEYLAELRLGQRTDTLDAEGRVTETVEDFSVTEDQAREVIGRFQGDIRQSPPMYSAIKVGGRPLYKLAREGKAAQVPERLVRVSSISLVSLAPPCMTIRVVCSKGTYVRTLADDIGRALGPGAHLAGLRRLRVGPFSVEDAAPPDALAQSPLAALSIDRALSHLEEVVLNPREHAGALNGRPVEDGRGIPEGRFLRLKSPEGGLFAVGLSAKGAIRVERLLHLRV
ncbi:MAG: tRNA pseudouridine(55) synthase TruB [Thermodesulfovibrionales bacterium]